MIKFVTPTIPQSVNANAIFHARMKFPFNTDIWSTISSLLQKPTAKQSCSKYYGKHLQLLRKFREYLIIMAKKRNGKWKSNYENLLFNLQFLKRLENCMSRTTNASRQQCLLCEENKCYFLCFFHELQSILSCKIDLLHVIKLFYGSYIWSKPRPTKYNLNK